MEEWVKDYVGIPFLFEGRDRKGADCFGLVVLVYREIWGKEIQDYLGYGPEPEPADFARSFESAEKDSEWYETVGPEEGGLVLLRRSGHPLHVGLCLGDGKMLHTTQATGSVVEAIHGPRWGGKVLGFYAFGGEA
jgi:cell wall-associated NlpC family hydrolase